MKYYAGLDVSLKDTSVCIVDERRRIVKEGRVGTEPETIDRAMGEFETATPTTPAGRAAQLSRAAQLKRIARCHEGADPDPDFIETINDRLRRIAAAA